ncbi:hypothetical protein Osc7112_0538 [Oscillatoria nigro-viridis PCC 7112]|uniref:Uncharacterized protein n=1 Tax=Phormidium nigroviride PCC 7112 TaxID=179408 RepID=K9VCB1_9CYAN|nr:hypothetical protein Osc7112_0538 [Oscillatoria nigro-viridis PCC 7112]
MLKGFTYFNRESGESYHKTSRGNCAYTNFIDLTDLRKFNNRSGLFVLTTNRRLVLSCVNLKSQTYNLQSKSDKTNELVKAEK